jgi:kinesin family member 6/9
MPDDGSIRTFLRIRPSRDPSGLFVQDEDDSSRLKFEIPVELKAGVLVNNTQTRHDFKFTNILGPLATQEEVFNMIGRDAVINVLDGYNSTIFAYGQTGSGKTFTVTGGAERYVDRGIIPRGLSLLFGEAVA